MVTVTSESSRHPLGVQPAEIHLVNAAFLQEIKDSNPPLWHATHDLRVRCQLEPPDCETPQATIKAFAGDLDRLRDLLALQFALEESYGYLTLPAVAASSLSPDALQTEAEAAIDQHRLLYLQIVDLVEESEELQYRGCDQNCLRGMAEKVDDFLRCLTAHERLENELIRLSKPTG